MLSAVLPEGVYGDVAGLCAAASLGQIKEQGWSLNPGRYVDIAVAQLDEGAFAASFEKLHCEFIGLSDAAVALVTQVSKIGKPTVEND